ncbi:MAG: HAD family hydrolase [Bacteroidaceae bacterium]
MKKLVIFDLDGTLINTISDLATSTNVALEACGFPTHQLEEYLFFVGNGVKKLFERALPEEERTPENIARIQSSFLNHYNLHDTDLSKPYPGIVELLTKLQSEGYILAVASNKYQDATTQIIKKLLPQIEFKAILGQRENIPIKPDPRIIYDILALTGCSTEETFFVGDSGVDMKTALNAKIKVCGVTWGFRSREELTTFSPAYLVDEAAEIYEALCKENKNI